MEVCFLPDRTTASPETTILNPSTPLLFTGTEVALIGSKKGVESVWEKLKMGRN
jgi:hypothetical protein